MHIRSLHITRRNRRGSIQPVAKVWLTDDGSMVGEVIRPVLGVTGLRADGYNKGYRGNEGAGATAHSLNRQSSGGGTRICHEITRADLSHGTETFHHSHGGTGCGSAHNTRCLPQLRDDLFDRVKDTWHKALLMSVDRSRIFVTP